MLSLPQVRGSLIFGVSNLIVLHTLTISFVIRQLQMNPTKPSFVMTMLYSYRNECTLNPNQL